MIKKRPICVSMALLILVSSTFSCVDRRYDGGSLDQRAHIAPQGVEIPLAVIEAKTIESALKGRNLVKTGEDGTYAVELDDDGLYAVIAADNKGFTIDGNILSTVASLPSPTSLPAGVMPAGGNLSHTIDRAVRVDLSDMIDLLTEIAEDISNCDMVAPTLTLGLTNPTKVTLALELKLLSRYGAEDPSPKQTIITLGEIAPATDAGSTTTWFFIATDGVEPPADGREYVKVRPENFADFMKEIPHAIDSHLSIGYVSGAPTDIDINETYFFGADYKMCFPLRFGHKMHLAVKLTEEGLGGVFSDIADKGVKVPQIEVKLALETTLQLKIADIKANFLDKEGHAIAGLATTITGAIQGPVPSENPTAQQSTLTIALAVPQGGDFKTLKAIDRLHLELPLKNTALEGQTIGFRPADYFKGRAWVKLPKGVEVDLNGLK